MRRGERAHTEEGEEEQWDYEQEFSQLRLPACLSISLVGGWENDLKEAIMKAGILLPTSKN